MVHKPIKESRVRRAANNIPNAPEIYTFLQLPTIIEVLEMSADQGDPPIMAVSELLITEFGKATFDHMNIRQFIGMAVKYIMQKQGYIPEDRGVRIPNDLLFTTGTTYIKAPPEPEPRKVFTLASVNEAGETLAFRLLNAAIPVMTRDEKISLREALMEGERRAIEKLKKTG